VSNYGLAEERPAFVEMTSVTGAHVFQIISLPGLSDRWTNLTKTEVRGLVCP
jgi:hypothetical protein